MNLSPFRSGIHPHGLKPEGTGKSRLSIEEQRQGVPHHLLVIQNDPNADFNATHFQKTASLVIESSIEKTKLPMFVGGSNSFIEALVDVQGLMISKRVDQMVEPEGDQMISKPIISDTMNLNSSFSHSKLAQPQMSLTSEGEVQNLSNNNKNKVIFIMGATGTGKSRLSIDLANKFSAEIINCDKIQVYKGFDTLTNKISEEQRQGVPHHLVDFINNPNVDYNATHFRNDAVSIIESIIQKNKLPIIVGGSNSFIEALVNDRYFGSTIQSCFLWLEVSPPILKGLISKRVDQMVESGLVDEVREIFDPEGDYSRGIRRAIGVSELDRFLRAEKDGDVDKGTLDVLLEAAINEIKKNTWKHACRQVEKIDRLRNVSGWNLQRIDATEALYLEGTEHNKKNHNNNGTDHNNGMVMR